MAQLLEDVASVLEKLTVRLNELERRIAELESQKALPSLVAAPRAVAHSHPVAQLAAPGSGVMPVMGRAFLGIAGAYILRALAESALLPKFVVVAVAIAYACMWLVLAARAAANTSFATIAYAVTAGLIVSPMLWELTYSFKVLPAGATASILFAFVLLAAVLGWKRDSGPLVWIATCFAAATGLVLLMATHQLVYFSCSLLLMAVIAELAAVRRRWSRLRPVSGIASDLALLALIYVYTAEAGVPPDYPAVRPTLVLSLLLAAVLLYSLTVTLRTMWLRLTITWFEVLQIVTVCLLAIIGALRITHGTAAPAVGVLCLLVAAGCYLAAFACFQTRALARNYHIYVTWAAVLFITGSSFLLPASGLAVEFFLAALAAVSVGVRRGSMALTFHAAVFLGAGAYISGALFYCATVLAGAVPSRPPWAVWLMLSTALLCYLISCSRALVPNWQLEFLQLLFSGWTVLAAATVIAALSVSWLRAAQAPHVAVIRSAVLCLSGVALAFLGARLQRRELIWLAYAVIALCTLKLLVEDLRSGSATAIAVSFFLYGLVWILVPRLARARQQAG